MKICTTCKESLPISMFGKKAKSGDGLSHICKPCKAEANRKYRAENKYGGVMANV